MERVETALRRKRLVRDGVQVIVGEVDGVEVTVELKGAAVNRLYPVVLEDDLLDERVERDRDDVEVGVDAGHDEVVVVAVAVGRAEAHIAHAAHAQQQESHEESWNAEGRPSHLK